MNAADLVTGLYTQWGKNLVSAIRYGMAAIREGSSRPEDQQLLIVLEHLTPADMAKGASLIRSWCKKENPLPFLCDRQFFLSSADIFPIEYLEMKDYHKVLLGEDYLEHLHIDHRHLRLQCESEMRGKLMHLQSEYVLAMGNTKLLQHLLQRSMLSFERVFHGVTHLLGRAIPNGRREQIEFLATQIDFSPDVFFELYDLHDGKIPWRRADPEEMFEHYLTAIQAITRYVDAYPLKGGSI